MREMECNEAWLMRLICSLCSTSHDTRHWPSHAWDVSLITRTLMTQMPHIWGPVSRHCCRCCDREVRWRVWHAECRCTSIIIWSLEVATKGIFDYKVIFHHTIRYSRSADALHGRLCRLTLIPSGRFKQRPSTSWFGPLEISVSIADRMIKTDIKMALVGTSG